MPGARCQEWLGIEIHGGTGDVAQCASCPTFNVSSPPWFQVGIKGNVELANLTRKNHGQTTDNERDLLFSCWFSFGFGKIVNPTNKQINKSGFSFFKLIAPLQTHPSRLILILNIPTELEGLRASEALIPRQGGVKHQGAVTQRGCRFNIRKNLLWKGLPGTGMGCSERW